MPTVSDARYLTELEAETTRLAAVLLDAEASHPVPTCPAWTLADLAVHVGLGQRWAASMVERRANQPLPQQETAAIDAPQSHLERADWLQAGARRLADAVREAGPATNVWSWADDHTAGFWLRRITHDTLVHRFDAELSVGRTVEVAADLGADGISDLLEMFRVLPRVDRFPALAELRGHGQTLHFHASDPGLGMAGEWLAERVPTGIDWEHRHGRADVTVRGPVRDLLLVMSRRLTLNLSALEVSGDRQLLDHWLEHSRLEAA